MAYRLFSRNQPVPESVVLAALGRKHPNQTTGEVTIQASTAVANRNNVQSPSVAVAGIFFEHLDHKPSFVTYIS